MSPSRAGGDSIAIVRARGDRMQKRPEAAALRSCTCKLDPAEGAGLVGYSAAGSSESSTREASRFGSILVVSMRSFNFSTLDELSATRASDSRPSSQSIRPTSTV